LISCSIWYKLHANASEGYKDLAKYWNKSKS